MKKLFRMIKIEYLVVALIIIVAAYLRLEGVFTNSFPFTYDIGRDLLVAQDIASFEKIPLIGATTGLPGLFYGPWWYYFLGLFYIPLQGNPTYFTGFIALTGVITVYLAFILGRKIDGNFLGLTFASLLAVSPVVISLTSQIWNPTLIPILWTATMLNLFLILKNRQKNIYFFSLGLLLSLIVDMEIVVGLLFGLGIVISLFFLRPKIITFKKLIFLILGGITILLPRIVFDIRHENILSKTLINGIYSMLLGGGESVGDLQIVHKLKVVFEYWNDTIALKEAILGGIILITTIFLCVKYMGSKNQIISFFSRILVITTSVTILGVLFFGHDIWPHYFVALPLLFVFMFSIAINGLYKNKKSRIFSVIFVVILFFLNAKPLELISSFKKPVWEGNAAVYRNQVNVIDHVYKNAKGNKFKFIVYTPPVHDYTYRYLFSWYGQKSYGYLSNDKDAKYLFVIIEPDYEYPSRVTDWLEIRKNDGKTIEEEKLKGGIIVQTRELK